MDDKSLELAVEECLGAFPTKGYAINCSTGCTCCSNEDFTEGLWRTKEGAQARIDFFKDPNAHNNPLASQYSKKGNYSIEEVDVEKISGDRIIIGKNYVYYERFVEDGGTPTRIYDYY